MVAALTFAGCASKQPVEATPTLESIVVRNRTENTEERSRLLNVALMDHGELKSWGVYDFKSRDSALLECDYSGSEGGWQIHAVVDNDGYYLRSSWATLDLREYAEAEGDNRFSVEILVQDKGKLTFDVFKKGVQ